MAEEHPAPGSFAERLDHLFMIARPEGHKPLSYAEVADSINKKAGENVISKAYVWQLRTGMKDNPTRRHIAALADYFGVSPNYFFESAEQGSPEPLPLHVQLALQDDTVRTLAIRAYGLPEEMMAALQDMVDRARTLQGLPDIESEPEPEPDDK